MIFVPSVSVWRWLDASPDRTRMFGIFDINGRFHRIASETFSDAEAFWLSYLEGMEGVEKFYLLDGAKYLLVKYRDEAEVRISILEHDGAMVSEAYSICREAV